MCAGDVARPSYSKLFSSHFEPLSALNLLQENPLKDVWSKEAAQDAKNENKPISVSPVAFVDQFRKTQNDQSNSSESCVIYLPKPESSNPTQKVSILEQNSKINSECNVEKGCQILSNLASSKYFAIACDFKNVSIPIQGHVNNELPLVISANSLPTILEQKEIIVNKIHINTTESESKSNCKESFLINANSKKHCSFSRFKENTLNSSYTGSLRLSKRRLRKKSDYRYCDTIRAQEKYFHLNNNNCHSISNRCPKNRHTKKHISKRNRDLEFTFENFQRYLRNSSDLHASERRQTSGNSEKNFKFSGRKPTRRNSLSQISFGDINKAQNDTEITQRGICNDPNSSSMEEFYSSKFKTRRKSHEFCNESSRNTIKLIDKILHDEPFVKYSKPVKSLSFDRTFPKRASQLTASQEKPRCHSTDSECSIKSKVSNDSISTSSYPRSTSVLRRRSSSITRPASLDVPFQQHISRAQSKGSDLSTNSHDSMRNSLDGLVIGADGRNDRHDGVNSFLERLDKVLSDVVEEETKKIVTMKVPCNHELYMDRNYVSSVSYLKMNPIVRDTKYATVNPKTQKLKRYKSTDYDMLERHKKRFTEGKLYKPRILKTNSQSELRSLKDCYQVPRPKRKRKRTAMKKDKEENGINYKDDFELIDSSDDRDQESSSEQESIKEMINSSLDKERVDDDNVNSNFPNNNVDSRVSKKYIEFEECKQPDDEDDTCYGSDQFGSDMMNDRFDTTSKVSRQAKKFSIDHRENSIDSAYTGSREPTPDICSSGTELAITLPKSKLKYNAIKNEKVRSASFVNPADTVVQRMNDAKLFLLEKIKDTGLYSDANINSLLDYYSRKWHHIPEREMKIIASFIRRDLGVKAPPKTYIDHLLRQSDNTSQFNQEFTTEECVTALSTTLPNYLKVFRDKRKAASTSCSPEPSIFFKSRSNLNNYPGRYYEPFDYRDSNKPLENNQQSHSGIMSGELLSRKSNERDDYSEPFPTSEFGRNEYLQKNGYSLLSNDYDDEEWIRNNVGEDVLDDVKLKISNIKETEQDCKVLVDDVEKLANEMCERFGIIL